MKSEDISKRGHNSESEIIISNKLKYFKLSKYL